MRSNPASATGDRYDRSRDLNVAIEKTGYYPTVVSSGVDAALAGEPVVSFLVHHEPTIDRDEVRRHMTVAVLTPSRLILAHTDENPPDNLLPEPYTSTSTEAIGLTSVRSVVVNRMVANPARLRGRVPPPAEAVLTVGWGGVAGVDLEPAMCDDPQCDADHGYTGTLVGDDLTVRMSVGGDGQERVSRLVRFGAALQRAATA